MAHLEDSFAERMRNRALQRLQRNADIMNSDNDVDFEPVFKKPNISTKIIEPDNKENIACNNDSFDLVKPKIAEHLTVRKSLSIDEMDSDEPKVFIKRNSRQNIFTDENTNDEREDVYAKHCKSRLANLAGKFKQFEEEDSHIPVRPLAINNKNISTKKRSAESELGSGDMSTNKNSKCEGLKKNELRSAAHIFTKPDLEKRNESKKLLKTTNQVQKMTETAALLDQSVVKTLESQGYLRTASEAHLFYDFKTAKNAFDKESKSNNTTKKQPPEVVKIPGKKEITNLYSNLKYQSNVFIQNSRKLHEQDDNNSTDPSLLSVAERRKLFEKRLADGAATEMQVSNHQVHTVEKKFETARAEIVSTPANHICDSENEYSTCESENNSSGLTADHELVSSSETPMSDDDEDISDHGNDRYLYNSKLEHYDETDQENDVSIYPVLQTVKQVKFVSTPKPGRLYPSVSDLDGEVDEDLSIPKHDNSYNDGNDDSFGREVLCATNSIFSSFQNSKKDNCDVTFESKTNILSEVKDLISTNEFSLSLSPVAKTSVNSLECANETASFTFMKSYPNNSTNLSPISVPNRNDFVEQPDFCNEDETDAKIEDDNANKNEDEMNVTRKIKLLEEQIVKEKIKLTQAIRALKLCQSTSFLNSVSHLEAEKLVLLSRLRIEAAQNEIDRMKVENTLYPHSTCSDSVQGNVVISKIKLPVKMSFVHADLKEDIYNNLICVIKCRETVLVTEVVSVVQNKIKQEPECTYIEFTDTITIPNVHSDFKINVEVYNLVVEKKDDSSNKHNQGQKKDKKAFNSSKKDKIKKNVRAFCPEDKKNFHSSFIMVGHMIFSHNEVQRHQWILNKQDLYHTPLVGMILMQLRCNLSKIIVQKHGFLTMYEMISGYGAWCRYWFFLNGDKLSFWKYPEQETTQESIGSFDLRKCISKDVAVVGYDIVFRPQTFILQFSPPTYLLQFKGLTENRLLLSADNEEERMTWCECLNKVLKSVRSWSNPDE